MISESPVIMASVRKCISDMIAYLEVMIDNTDAYYHGKYGRIRLITQTTSPGYVHACDDVANIKQAATECIEIIEKQKNTN